MNHVQRVIAALTPFLVRRVSAATAWNDKSREILAYSTANCDAISMKFEEIQGETVFWFTFNQNSAIKIESSMLIRDDEDARASIMEAMIPVCYEIMERTPETMPLLEGMFLKEFEISPVFFKVTFDSDLAEFCYGIPFNAEPVLVQTFR